MKQPKKIIRHKVIAMLKEGEWECIQDPGELHKLYALKITEEVEEIKASGYKDVMEFADLIQAATSWAREAGFSDHQIMEAMNIKSDNKGVFGRIALTNLNPNNPSNEIYFKNQS